MMKIETLPCMGDFGTNAYIVSSSENALLIDAPCDPEYILEKLGGKKLLAILLTHGHVDHISAAEEIRIATGCKVYISENDKMMLSDPESSLASYFSLPLNKCTVCECFKDGDTLTFGDMEFKAIETPGHTPGSSCFVIDKVIFSGDTLFRNSIGRDFGWSCYKNIIKSIKKLYDLGGNYKVYPGHDGDTELYDELMFNPYLGELKEIID